MPKLRFVGLPTIFLKLLLTPIKSSCRYGRLRTISNQIILKLFAYCLNRFVVVKVGDPNTDHNCWERPEDMDTPRTVYSIDAQNPGSDVAGETAAAMAAASIVFRTSDLPYSQRLFETATQVLQNKRHSYNYNTIALLIQCTLIPICIDIHDTDFYYAC